MYITKDVVVRGWWGGLAVAVDSSERVSYCRDEICRGESLDASCSLAWDGKLPRCVWGGEPMDEDGWIPGALRTLNICSQIHPFLFLHSIQHLKRTPFLTKLPAGPPSAYFVPATRFSFLLFSAFISSPPFSSFSTSALLLAFLPPFSGYIVYNPIVHWIHLRIS